LTPCTRLPGRLPPLLVHRGGGGIAPDWDGLEGDGSSVDDRGRPAAAHLPVRRSDRDTNRDQALHGKPDPDRISAGRRPLRGHDAAIERDPEFIADITEVWRSYRDTTRAYFARLKQHREEEVDRAEEDRLDDAIDRLKDLAHYPFKAVELDSAVDEERVAEIFVRINSEGVTLNQADFILTLMSVWWDKGRRQLEEFSRAATQLPTGPLTIQPFHPAQPRPASASRGRPGIPPRTASARLLPSARQRPGYRSRQP
jgi:hypothetical protein